MKNNNKRQTLVKEAIKQRPILTEHEMNFMTYEEAVQKCLEMFDEDAKRIEQEYALHTNTEKQ